MNLQIYENRLTIAQFQELRLKCGMDMLDNGMLKLALSNSAVRLSAEHNNKIVGMLRVVGDMSFTFIIVDVLVAPGYRRMGIGSALIKYAAAAVKRIIPDGAWTTISLFSVKGKENFYKRLGFQKTPLGEVGCGMQMFVKGETI